MKYLVAVLFVLSSALPLGAQQYVIEWADTIDNGDEDNAYGIAVDGSGNVYVTGLSYIGTDRDYFTVKYDSLGNISWVDTLDNGDDDGARGIAVDDGGNVYVTGYFYISGNAYDYLIVKYNESGNIIWINTFNNGEDDKSYDIAVDNNGNVYVTGKSYIPGTPTGSEDYFTLKYDSFGNIIWADTLDNGGYERAYGIAVDGSGNVYVTGRSYNGTNSDYFTVKYGPSGNIVWTDTLDNGYDDVAEDIAVDGNGNVYVTGYSSIGGDYDYFTVKYDSLGNIIWVDTLDNGGNDYAYGITADNSGNIYVTGTSYIGSTYDQFTVKYDSLENILWADTIDNGDNDNGKDIAVDIYGNIYTTGYIVSGSLTDYFTVKYLPQQGIPNQRNIPTSNKSILNVSSINRSSINFSYNVFKNTSCKITLYSIDGRIIRKIEGKGSGHHRERISGLPSGIYFLRLEQGKEVVNKKVILVK